MAVVQFHGAESLRSRFEADAHRGISRGRALFDATLSTQAPAIPLFLDHRRLGEHARDVCGCEDNLNEAVAAVSVRRSGRFERGA